MAIVELLYPHWQKDPNLKTTLLTEFEKGVVRVKNANAEVNAMFVGWIVDLDGKNVREEYKGALIADWQSVEAFGKWVQSPELQLFIEETSKIVASKPVPRLYGLSSAAEKFGKSGVPEVIQINLKDTKEAEAVKSTWKKLEEVVRKDGTVTSGGLTIAMGEGSEANDVFTGLLGWDSQAVRDQVVKTKELESVLEELKGFGELSQMILELNTVSI